MSSASSYGSDFQSVKEMIRANLQQADWLLLTKKFENLPFVNFLTWWLKLNYLLVVAV